jgi:hypothetical protein
MNKFLPIMTTFLISATAIFFSTGAAAHSFKPIISCRNNGSEVLVITQDFNLPSAFQIVVKSKQNIDYFYPLFGALNSSIEFLSSANSPEWNVFVGQSRDTNYGRGHSLARLVAHYYEDSKSVVLVGDYGVYNDSGRVERFYESKRITIWGCESNPKY